MRPCRCICNRLLLTLLFWGSVIAGSCAIEAAAQVQEPPNVLVIMADDMGYSDLGAYGGEIDTPELDALAADGLQFTNFYTNNMCVPTRASLLTGVYPQEARRNGVLTDQAVTIAEVLGSAGYSTWMTGKWHLGPWTEDRSMSKESWPLQQGFGRFFGTIIGANSYFAPNSLTRGNRSAEKEYLREDFYYTDAIGNNAIRFMEQSLDEDRPFFGYVAFTAAHWPLHALPEDIAKYEGKYDEGWDVLRQRRYERMIDLNLIPSSWPLSPRNEQVPAWDSLSEERKAWEARQMEVYAAQVDRMDQNIGRIVEALREAGELDNTLLFFLIDNGACHVELPPSRTGWFLPDSTRDGQPVRNGNLQEIMAGPEDTYQSYGWGWANLSNTPFRWFKKFDHEGGIRTPLIVHWPAGVDEPGRLTRAVGHNMDIMATIVDATDAPYPSRYDGHDIQPLQGKSLLPVVRGEERAGHERIFWQWARGRAVRQGPWKLVARDDEPWQLYHLKRDGVELKDLADQEPARVQSLEAVWQQWIERVTE